MNELLQRIAGWRERVPRFTSQGLVPWTVDALPAGWVRPDLAARMLDSALFEQTSGGLALADHLGGPLGRSRALQAFAETLRADGWIDGWRDEAYDWLDDWGRVRFSLERAAFRTLGLCSRAVHVNGYRDDDTLWIGRRAAHKAVDPGRLDNLAAGGIASGETPEDTLVRELAEEAGVPGWLAALARPAQIVRTTRLEPEGVHDELLYCFDLPLPPDFVPANIDGEVAGFEPMKLAEAAARLDEMTWDAATVTVGWIERWLDGEV
ncbi:NUDIX hydrolase [Chitinimonas koreensis]|uniref:NUDIX hydrolase n=1 Tax=Chitinimonas koreensis TaxID=356302 RepID=UPI0004046171|nr:DUF4743 domain-containing protein [Chitinimonas koreensis]QNM95859.1 DUF4743 domain-containing protein [Chitinimonas koreensis]